MDGTTVNSSFKTVKPKLEIEVADVTPAIKGEKVGVGAPIIIYFALGERSQHVLEGLKSWMAANNTVIMAVLLLIIGVKLLGDGISGL